MEPAALSVELENRAGHRRRQHRYRQAERAHADDGLHPLRDRARSRFAEGVLNIVHGTGPNVGAAITAHPKINTISFTGGTVTGRKVAEACAPLFKKVSLELGGKNPNIIFADADLEAAIAGSVRSSFANQGQICLCGSRVFVERSVYKDFVERFIEKASQLKMGDPLDEKTDQGAIVSKTQLDKVKFYVDLAQKEGGKVALGGKAPESINERCRDGYFFQPTVITGLPVSCRTNREEIFGPVVTITPFENEEEVISYANDCDYGLASSVWTQNWLALIVSQSKSTPARFG